MSGSSSSARGSTALQTPDSPLSLTVHSMPPVALDAEVSRRTNIGRMKMALVFLVCAAPVVASYVTYFFVHPQGRSNYSTLIQPQRPIPASLPLTDLKGVPVAAASLKGQWLLVVVSGAACDKGCEHRLWLQRQLRETLGREKDRVDKVWLIDDGGIPSPRILNGVVTHTEATVLKVPAAALASWLEPAAGHALDEHLYIVDPMGNWMMRAPADAEPAKLKRDFDKLLRASASWDLPGR